MENCQFNLARGISRQTFLFWYYTGNPVICANSVASSYCAFNFLIVSK